MIKDVNVLIVSSSEEAEGLKAGLQSSKNLSMRLRSSSLDSAWQIVVNYKPNVVVMFADADYEQFLQLIKKIKDYYAGIKLIFICDNDDSDYILTAYKSGINDYLKIPYNLADVQRAISLLFSGVEGPSIKSNAGKCFTVFSNKGGIGVTTVAVNLAVALARKKDTRVLLCDFVLHHGDIGIFLDTERHYPLNELVVNLDRADKTFLENSLPKATDGLYVLHCPENPEDGDFINNAQVAEVLINMKKHFDFIVVDMDHDFNDNNITIFDNSDVILELLTLELPCICNCGKTLEVFQKLRYERDKVKLVVNRTNAKNQIEVRLVEEQLNYPIFYQLPNDYGTVVKAINNGKSIFNVSRTAGISNALNGLCEALLMDMHKEFREERKGLLSKFLKKII